MIAYIIDLVYITVMVAFAYCIILIAIRADKNIEGDNELKIETRGTRSWGRGSMYNRAESTPYLALDSFVKNYEMDANDRLVDYGCGKGRVAIYMHNNYKIPVSGIELNDLTYQEAIDNVKSYIGDNESKGNKLTIEQEYAEHYRIKDDENKFFFFNPFHSDIFKKVVINIIKSADEYDKEVEIILYYPIKSYRNILDEETQFKLINEIKASGSLSPREKFQVWKYSP